MLPDLRLGLWMASWITWNFLKGSYQNIVKTYDLLFYNKYTLFFSGTIPVDRCTSREKNQPLCMAQYYRLLGGCRRPGIERDSQFLPESSPDQHVIVVCRNQMYCVPIRAGDRGRLTENEIASQILFILGDAPCLPVRPPPVGLLTAEPRNKWAQDRNTLLLNDQNCRNIELIERALILLCLDEPIPNTFNARGFNGAKYAGHMAGTRNETNMAHEMIHGGGSEYNTANRWFDKTMQIILSNDGTWGLCYEHSPSEGIAVIQLLEKIYKKIDSMPLEEEGVPQHHLPPPERLEWIIAPEISRRFTEASKSVDRLVGIV